MKNIIIKLLALCMILGIIVGCRQNQQEEIFYVSIDGYSDYDNATVYFTHNDGDILETGSLEIVQTKGKTVKKIIADNGYTFTEVKCENDTFEGWLQFVVIVITDDDGFEYYEYQLVSEELFTTDEMLEAMMSADKNISFVAKWKGLAIEDYYPD